MPLTVVTGASGQDGTYLCRRLLAEGGRVLGVVRPGSTAVLAAGIERIECDVSTSGVMESLVRTYQPDEFFNLAAESFSPACTEQPVAACDLMARAVLELLEAVRRHHPTTRIFQASSSEMFGDPAVSPQNELTPLQPRTIYGVAKAFAHQMCGFYRARHGLFISSGILYSHESPLRRGGFLSKKVCQSVARIAANLQQKLSLGDLAAVRDWSHAGDVAAGIRLTLQTSLPQDFVFASGVAHSVSDFCAVAFTRAGLDWRAHVVVDPSLVRKESRAIIGNPERARRELGWKAETSFVALVHELVDVEISALAASRS